MMEETQAPIGQGDAPDGATPTENSNTNNMETLLNEQGIELDFPQAGEIRTGVIASINPTQILVSVGAKSEGVITGRELESIPSEVREAFKEGEEILVYVINAEDENGNVVLSFTRAQEQKGWMEVEKLLEDGSSVESVVDGYNKGGVIVPVHGLRGFIPASQLGISRRMGITGDTPEERYSSMIGEPITIRVIEVDRNRRRLILSERAASSETRQSIKEKVIESLKEGNSYSGKVTSLADFGAFVNVNGADGLVHLSEISWDRIQHPSEVLEVGQEVKVKVINIDRDKRRIGLSIRALENDPWQGKVDKFKVGQLVEGVITRLTKFGAFARLEGDLEGLIHISEISENRIEHPREAGLHEGDVVTLRIIRIDPDQRRIGLSLRKVDSGAYKDLDLKQIDLEGVTLEMADGTVVAEEKPKSEKKTRKTKQETQETEETPAEEEKPAKKVKPTKEEKLADVEKGEVSSEKDASAVGNKSPEEENPPKEDTPPAEEKPLDDGKPKDEESPAEDAPPEETPEQ